MPLAQARKPECAPFSYGRGGNEFSPCARTPVAEMLNRNPGRCDAVDQQGIGRAADTGDEETSVARQLAAVHGCPMLHPADLEFRDRISTIFWASR